MLHYAPKSDQIEALKQREEEEEVEYDGVFDAARAATCYSVMPQGTVTFTVPDGETPQHLTLAKDELTLAVATASRLHIWAVNELAGGVLNAGAADPGRTVQLHSPATDLRDCTGLMQGNAWLLVHLDGSVTVRGKDGAPLASIPREGGHTFPAYASACVAPGGQMLVCGEKEGPGIALFDVMAQFDPLYVSYMCWLVCDRAR